MKSRIVESYKEENILVFNKRFGVIFNGESNVKPFIIENLIDSSPTAFQSAGMYANFIGGAGFVTDFSDISLSNKPWELRTPNDLLYDVAESLSRHQGVFVHVGYNALYEKTDFKVLPYSTCRLGKLDDDNYSGKIVVSKKGWGKNLKKEDVQVFNAYNPQPEVIQYQVEKAGGWENYKGQIFYFKLSDKHIYSRSLIETAYTFADAEHHMGLFYNSIIKRGFNDITIVRHRPFENKTMEREFDANAKRVSGGENASSVWMIEDDSFDSESKDSGAVRFDKITSDQKPDRYKHMEESSANYIRKAFKNIPPILVDYIQGKLGGTSGNDIKIAQSIYNSSTASDRKKVSSLFKELFRNFEREIVNPDWEIKQYSILEDGTVEESQEVGE